MAAVCAGLFGVGLGGGARSSASGLRWSLLCAAAIAGYHLSYKEALAAQASPPALFAVSLAVALPLNLAFLGKARLALLPGRLRESPLLIGATGILCTAAFVIFLRALALSGAGAVLTLRNTSVIFAQGFSLALGERPSPRQLAGVGLVALGAVLIGWP